MSVTSLYRKLFGGSKEGAAVNADFFTAAPSHVALLGARCTSEASAAARLQGERVAPPIDCTVPQLSVRTREARAPIARVAR